MSGAGIGAGQQRELASLLATIGTAGPVALSNGEGADVGAQNHAFVRLDDGDDVDVRCLETSSLALALLNDARLLQALDRAFGTHQLLLSRFDRLKTGAHASWRRAASLRSRNLTERSFLPGATILVALCEASVEVELSSHRLTGAVADFVGMKRTYQLPPGEALVLASGARYRPSAGEWFRIVFVRGWIRPDVLFCEALTPAVLASLTEEARAWTGVGQVPPRDLGALFAAEAEALTEAAHGQYGRGI